MQSGEIGPAGTKRRRKSTVDPSGALEANGAGPSESAATAGGREATKERQARTVATVERAADVLLHFVTADDATLGITEISDELEISKAAVHRILSSLRGRDLVRLDERSRRYSLGPAAMTLGLSYLDRLDVRRLAAAELRGLSNTTHETATLSLRTGDTRVYVEEATPPREVIMSVSIGVPFPLHAGASSRAFLAFLPDQYVESYLATKGLPALTDCTITDEQRLRCELARTRSFGYAQSTGERQAGAASVAAPVFDHRHHPVAVISVCGPADRFNQEAEACARQLGTVTRRLSALMGHLPQAHQQS
jgi:DNA-binding IclR family transcriptional regulator